MFRIGNRDRQLMIAGLASLAIVGIIMTGTPHDTWGPVLFMAAYLLALALLIPWAQEQRSRMRAAAIMSSFFALMVAGIWAAVYGRVSVESLSLSITGLLFSLASTWTGPEGRGRPS